MNLKHALPFLEDDELESLAKKVAESPTGVYQGVSFTDLLPFVDEEDVDRLMIEGYKKGTDIHRCYPFASDEGLSSLVQEALKEGAPEIDLRKMLAFLEDEDLNRIGQKILAKGGRFDGLSFEDLLPFLDEDVVDEAFLQKVKAHDPSAKNYAPFVSDDAYHKLARAFADGELKDIDLDSFYPFMDEEDVRLIFKTILAEE
jgi:hypothetical protein